MPRSFATFEEFWPHYLRQHADRRTRHLHIAGTATGLALAAAAIIFQRRSLGLAAIVVAYGSAWIAHHLIEKNRPATFGHPLWSLRGDLRMSRLWMMGKLEPELRRAGVLVANPAG